MKKLLLLGLLPFVLAACNGGPSTSDYGAFSGEESLGGSLSTDAFLLAPGPKWHVGAPYKIEDTLYTPAEDMNFNQTGIAGIIPTDLNGVMTTNGEIFDSNQMLGTSKTLPLPSIVRVTNLENGRTAIVRVNNRGPFVNNRMMDVSTTAARQLGMTGNTRVQVQIMAEQSLAVKNATLGTTSQLGIVRDEPAQTPVPVAATGPYTVQVGAFYSEDSAQQLASRIRHLGNVQIDNESGLHKVRVVGLDAPGARSTIDSLRSSEGLAPGLLMNGRWINADSI